MIVHSMSFETHFEIQREMRGNRRQGAISRPIPLKSARTVLGASIISGALLSSMNNASDGHQY